jgi:hypothetical protein
MKPMTSIALAALLGMSLLACSKKDGGDDKGTAAVKASPEMDDFLAGMGSSAKVKASLEKHAAPGVATQDMEMYDLKDARATAEEKRGAQTCYTFDAKAGATTRTYVTCWEGGKIALVEDKGMR